MLIRDTLRYLPAQLLSPLAQLASMVLWTHWLAPAGMGVFTLVTVAQELAYMACLGWFSVYALRFLPAADDVAGRRRYLATENAVVLASVVAGLVGAGLTLLALPAGHQSAGTLLAIGAFFATKACNQHYAERARAQSAFMAYTLLQLGGPVGGLLLGWLAMQHLAATPALLLGAYAVAQLVGMLLAWPSLGLHWGLARPDLTMLKSAIGFGGPVLGLLALGWVGENYIRYLVQWREGATTLGLMVVGWALGRRCASVVAMLVTTAAFPLAARLLNAGRRDEALAQLRTNAILLIAVLLPATTLVELLGDTLVELVVAPVYREMTAELLSLSMLAGAVRNLHLHVTDQLMVLEKRWTILAWLDVAEISLCALASLAGLALWGLHGAVLGQGLGSLLMLGLSIHVTRTRMGFDWPWQATAKVLLACGAVAGVLVLVAPRHDIPGLVLAALLGALVYAGAMAGLFRGELRQAWAQWRGPRVPAGA